MRKQPQTECERFRPLLELQADGRIARRQRVALDRHLATCSECRRTQAELRSLDRLLRTLPRSPAPPTFGAGVRAQVRALRPAWTAGRRTPLPVAWRSLVVEAVAAFLVVSCGVAWISRAGGWGRLDKLTRATAQGVATLADQGKQVWTPRGFAPADLGAAVANNYRVWRNAVLGAVRSLRAFPDRAAPWLAGPSVGAWGLGGAILLLNLLLEFLPLPWLVSVKSTGRSSP